MRLTQAEIDFLSVWAREEWEPDCYRRPAHRQQRAQGVRGGELIDLIKAWTEAEGKKDQDILAAADIAEPVWPWKSEEELRSRLGLAREAVMPAPAARAAKPLADR